MALPSDPHRHISAFLQSTASNFASLFNPPNPPPLTLPSSVSLPLFFAPPLSALDSSASSAAAAAEPPRPAAKSVRVARLGANGKAAGGPAFVGQVFSMCDLSGTGLMAVSTHFDIPFIPNVTLCLLSCRSEASFLRATESSSCLDNSGVVDDGKLCECIDSSNRCLDNNTEVIKHPSPKLSLPFGGWFRHLWPKQCHEKVGSSRNGVNKEDLKPTPFLPKVTMVGLSTEESGQMSKANLKKTMEDLTKELEKTEIGNMTGDGSKEFNVEDRDPLFVANVGDYYSGLGRAGSGRWIRGGSN
ncbi:uncharacterized protein LOC109803706 [Cajanus cajan]|uniref:uncharacterized protein LOC109803706 n=1 Tax=Cajanus cajan TaxID=3821 RepID=UPI00098DACAD|nr:uncharacterized protein LOC109803706 [Cajanus cajan]